MTPVPGEVPTGSGPASGTGPGRDRAPTADETAVSDGTSTDGAAEGEAAPGTAAAAGERRRRPRRATGGVAPTREVEAAPSWDEVDRETGRGPESDDDRITREVPPHW